MDIKELLGLTVKNNASDLHLMPDLRPTLRIDGQLEYLTNYPVLTTEDIELMLYSLMTPEQKELLLNNKELDFSVGYGEGTYGNIGRFRINAYYQRGYLCGAFRFLPMKIKTIDELGLPKICHEIPKYKQGLVLVTGPTGHGKSTTLAAIINEINLTTSSHIITIEDPIEYTYPNGKSIISQREMGIDTHSWAIALKSSLREDPDVVFVGEMRDTETMEAAMTLAETGHLVLSTLHTNSAAQSIDRIVGAFPPFQKEQIRIQLAATLRMIISQRLLPQLTGGRILAVEILLGTDAVKSNIQEGKTNLIDSIIQTSQDVGMMTIELSLASLVRSGIITLDTAKSYTLHPDELLRLIG